MRNGKIKANKTKIVARVMLVVLLLSSAINLSGCGKEDEYIFHPHSPELHNYIHSIAYSSGRKFYIDNVNINVSYAIHKLNIFGEVKPDAKEKLAYNWGNYSLYIYMCNSNTSHEYGPNYDHCCLLLKHITDEELFSKEFGCIDTPFFINNGVVYNHTDNIVIPKSFFDDDSGTIRIKLQLYVDTEESGNFYVTEDRFMVTYEKTGDSIFLTGT